MIAKRRAIQILSLVVVVLAVSAGLLAAYSPAGSGGADGAEEAVYPITDISVSQVAALAITNEMCKFGVMMKDGEIEVVSEVQGSYSTTELRSLVYAAAHLTGSRKISDLSDGEQYGMEKPLASLSLILTDGSQIDLFLLKENPLDGNYYMYAPADQAIYVVPADVAGIFLRSETDFFSHTVFPLITASNYPEVEEITVEYGGEGRDFSIEQRNDGFYLVKPIEQRLTAMTTLQKLLIPVSALYSDGFVASGADLKEYGFEDYSMRIEMRFGGQTYAGRLLNKEDGGFLMADEQSGDVYELEAGSLDSMAEDYLELLDGKAFSYAAGDVKSVAVDMDGDDVLAELPGGEKEQTLFAALNGAEIAGEAANEEGGSGDQSGEPAARITFTMLSGSIEVVELLPGPGGEYFVRVNGVTNFTTTGRYLQGVRSAAGEYKN